LRGSSAPFSLSFSGSGFLALYQVGVVQSLLELAPRLLQSAGKVYGSSAGSLIAAAVVCGISLGKTCPLDFLAVGSFSHPGAILGSVSWKSSLLLSECYLRWSGRCWTYLYFIGSFSCSCCRTSLLLQGLSAEMSIYIYNPSLSQALLCSCFLPVYCGFIPPSYRGVRYVDGGFTGLQPVSSLEEAVITVSPFTGELDICPRDCPATFFCFQIFNGSIQISMENLLRISYALFPPSTMV
ncbi:PLPL1 protein, partial [Columbina picui]|nr:PLPL1 protein [Columbina picui]